MIYRALSPDHTGSCQNATVGASNKPHDICNRIQSNHPNTKRDNVPYSDRFDIELLQSLSSVSWNLKCYDTRDPTFITGWGPTQGMHTSYEYQYDLTTPAPLHDEPPIAERQCNLRQAYHIRIGSVHICSRTYIQRPPPVQEAHEENHHDTLRQLLH